MSLRQATVCKNVKKKKLLVDYKYFLVYNALPIFLTICIAIGI